MKRGRKPNPKPVTDIATLMELNSAQFGTALIDQAKKNIQNQHLEKSVAATSAILYSLDECETRIAYFEGWKKTRLGQLDALQKGAFKIDRAGEIVYNDSSLNRN